MKNPLWLRSGFFYQVFHCTCIEPILGHFLGMNNETLHRARASGTHLCMMVDLMDELVQGFPIMMGTKNLGRRQGMKEKVLLCEMLQVRPYIHGLQGRGRCLRKRLKWGQESLARKTKTW